RYGPTCLCLASSTRTYNYLTHHCDDVDECRLARPQCSHRCVNGDGHYRCECDEGYKKDDTRNEIKFLKVKSKQLVTVATGIKQVLVGLGLEDPGDISIDWLGGNFYFSDAKRRSISACRLDGAVCTDVPTHAKHPKKMYWADWFTHAVIMSANMDGSNAEVLVDNLDTFASVYFMYWADWFSHAVIMSDNMDGSNAEVLVDNLDTFASVYFMYWADWFSHAVIMSANMDGSNAEVLVDNLDTFASGLSVDVPNERLYYVDKTVKVVMIKEKAVY
ncbi:Vitellogenin receptor, partial [Operophtera brumata]